jgi:hypothetical protein
MKAGLYMAGDQLVDGDSVKPVEIEHRCDEIFEGRVLLQRYNYIIYHFDCGGSYFWARTYTDEIDTVSVYGPFENRDKKNLTSDPLDEAILSYLKRRFRKIQKLGEEGYTVVWSIEQHGE